MCYTNQAPLSVQGLNILEDNTRDKILTLLDAGLMYSEPFVHSYPYDWRAHCPVIILASRQWFLSTETLRQKAEVTNIIYTPTIMIRSDWMLMHFFVLNCRKP